MELIKINDLSSSSPESDGFVYLDVIDDPFVIGGIDHPKANQNEYYRLDAAHKDNYTESIAFFAGCTAGACVRFVTDADEISLRITLRNAVFGMHHFCDRGVYGIDAYVGTGSDRKYLGAMMQTFADNHDVNSGKLKLPGGVKEIMVNLPLYAGVKKFEVGFAPSDSVGRPADRRFKPIAFYGASITQGGCVSRPANAYANIVCRLVDADCRNLGFSGCGVGELTSAEYIAARELSCLVLDLHHYTIDQNAFASTLQNFFDLVRAKQPELPILILPHTYFDAPTELDLKRTEAVRKTYKKAVAAGDKHVAFIESEDLLPKDLRDLYAVDNLHPNDLGHMAMAMAVAPRIKELLS